MLTPAEEEVLTEIFDLLIKLYVFRAHAKEQGDTERVNALELEITRAEAKRKILGEWENQGGILEGATNMAKITNRERRHVREKSIIDHVARELFEPKP